MGQIYKILVIGASWHGSNCTGLARGFRSLGHVVELVGDDQFVPKINCSVFARLFLRLIRPICVNQFNSYLNLTIALMKPDLIVVFKGNNIKPIILKKAKEQGIWITNFFPDTSFKNHRELNTQIFQYVSHIFTTKTFGVQDFKDQLSSKSVSFLQHGFDPQIHRPITILKGTNIFNSDVSFIGNWSSKKESIISDIVKKLPKVRFKIWGGGWKYCRNDILKPFITGVPIYGDYYALAISSSKINLGLLIEQQPGGKSGDLVTARTFEIPACRGFLLHERTDEVLEYFEENKEIACFGSLDELVSKIKYFLEHEEERQKIAKAGFERCIRENSMTNRAQIIIDKFEEET